MRKISILLGCLVLIIGCNDENVNPENPADMPYFVDINPQDFENTDIVGNSFFPLNSGKTFVYEGEDEDGVPVRVEEEYTAQTKVIMGVTCVVVNAREYEDGELIEDTFDWYAQDKEGNVWYFGEDTKEIENGQTVGTAGSWEAGVDGALPGVIMFAKPIPGLWYRQEYYAGEAEDVAQVLSLDESINVTFGNFSNCLQMAEWSPLEPGIVEHKFYAPEVGLVKVVAVKGESGFEELVAINE